MSSHSGTSLTVTTHGTGGTRGSATLVLTPELRARPSAQISSSSWVDRVASVPFRATARFDTYWQGAIGLVLAYSAAAGKITPSKESHEHREFNGPQDVVTKDNVDKYLVTPDPSKYDFNNPWQLSAGPITYS